METGKYFFAERRSDGETFFSDEEHVAANAVDSFDVENDGAVDPEEDTGGKDVFHMAEGTDGAFGTFVSQVESTVVPTGFHGQDVGVADFYVEVF